jgi:glutathionylspermidine synthase
VVAKGTEAYNSIKEAAAEKITELKSKKDDLDIEVEVILDDLEEKLEDLAEKAEAAAEEMCCEEDEE